jgi:hypothetical protein
MCFPNPPIPKHSIPGARLNEVIMSGGNCADEEQQLKTVDAQAIVVTTKVVCDNGKRQRLT